MQAVGLGVGVARGRNRYHRNTSMLAFDRGRHYCKLKVPMYGRNVFAGLARLFNLQYSSIFQEN